MTLAIQYQEMVLEAFRKISPKVQVINEITFPGGHKVVSIWIADPKGDQGSVHKTHFEFKIEMHLEQLEIQKQYFQAMAHEQVIRFVQFLLTDQLNYA